MRLFIAVDFNDLGDYFAKLQKLLPKNAKLSLTKTFHVTLKFLGEVQPDKAEEEEKIIELQKNIDESLKRLFKKEKDFKAHITLARVKYPEDKKDFVDQIKNIKVESKKIEIKDFKLIKSTLSPKGQVYEELTLFNSQ